MCTVLIVEDNVQLCSFYSRIVEHAGLNAATAYSCQEALDYLALPDGSGQLVIDYLRTLPDHKATHIAVVTGESQYKCWAVDMNVDTFLVKPVSSPALHGCRLACRADIGTGNVRISRRDDVFGVGY